MFDETYHNFNDTYGINKDWVEFKKMCGVFEVELAKFLGHKKNKKAGIRARKKLFEIRKFSKAIGGKILQTRQDYDSDYS